MAESASPTPASAPARTASDSPSETAPAPAAPQPATPPPSPEERRPARHRAATRRVTWPARRRQGARPGRLPAVAMAAAIITAATLTGVSGRAMAAEQAAIQAVVRPLAAVPAVPLAIQPPGNVAKVASYRVAFGVQIYACVAGAWKLQAPEALLVKRPGWRRTIHHFAGPSWQSNVDGSLVTAAKVAESPVAGAIPQLLLQVNSHSGNPNGELAKVTHIQRLDTRGGLAPTGACTEGARRPVRYGALYVFYAPR